jgi:hypothetical protein
MIRSPDVLSRHVWLVTGFVLGACVTSCESFTEVLGPTRFAASADGSRVKPATVSTSATGTLSASLHPTNGTLAYTFGWEDLSGAATSVHIHGPADENGVAAALIDFSALPTGSTGTVTLEATGAVTGTLDLTRPVSTTVSGDSLRKLLTIGRLYVDVHTAANPDGEIRGQVLRQ